MVAILAKINLTVEGEESEVWIREKIEEAMNLACSYLEQNIKSESIYYNIREMIEL